MEKSSEDKTNFLEEKLDVLIGKYQQKQHKSRGNAHICKVSILLLTASTPLLLGLKEYKYFQQYDDPLSVTALFFSAAAASIASWEAFSNYNWKWVHYRSMLSKLHQLKDEINYHSGSKIEAKKMDKYFSRLMTTLAQADSEWMQIRAESIINGTKGD